MNRHDKRLWRECYTMAAVGELTARWCEGSLPQTPSHLGPPCAETVPYLTLLAALNRTGRVVTTNSQSAGHRQIYPDVQAWNAWVTLFAGHAWIDSRRAALTAAGLAVEEMPRSLRGDEISFYRDRTTPEAAAELTAARYLWISDPTPGRNDRLWPALAALPATVERCTS